ncbi:MAG: hypothetical protein ACR2P1_15590, partial [Pseudomonadales bacterium]
MTSRQCYRYTSAVKLTASVCDMVTPEPLDLLKKDVQAWNAWRQDNPAIRPELRNADLRRLDLGGANLKG